MEKKFPPGPGESLLVVSKSADCDNGSHQQCYVITPTGSNPTPLDVETKSKPVLTKW